MSFFQQKTKKYYLNLNFNIFYLLFFSVRHLITHSKSARINRLTITSITHKSFTKNSNTILSLLKKRHYY